MTGLYSVWKGMISRCNHPSNSKYRHYGARGIKVCSEWMNFETFSSDMGERPEGMTIERIDNNGNYERANCRWATYTEQARNRRNNHTLTLNGETKTIAEWGDITGLSRETIKKRIEYGWSDERALTEPRLYEKFKGRTYASPKPDKS